MSNNAERKLTVSIDRHSKSWAVFVNHFTLLHGFVRYEDETHALQVARAKALELGDPDPEVIYPRITGLRMTAGRRRR